MFAQHQTVTARTPRALQWLHYLWSSLLLGLLLLLPTASLPANAQGGPPAPFSKLGPADGAIDLVSPINLRWEAAAGADYYTWCIDTSPGNVCEAGVNNSGYTRTTATSVSLILLAGRTYYWQVSAHNAAGQTFADGYLGWHSFTISPKPGAITKLEPANGATNLPTTLQFRWEAQPADGVTTSICIDTVENLTCDNPTWTPVVTPVPEFTLAPNTTYYWQMRGENAQGITYGDGASGWHSFTTGDGTVPTPTPTPTPIRPGPFTQLSPQDGATDVPNPVTLRWEEASGATDYSFCISQDNERCNVGFFETGDGFVGARTAVTLTLKPDTTFWWRVRAYNDQSFIAAGNTWISFTTTPRPIAVNKLAPLTNHTGAPTDVTLQWSKAPFVTDYRLCYDRTDNNQCDAGDAGWIPLGETSHQVLNGLEPNTLYSWQIRTHNIHGFTESDDGQWFRFRTGPAPFAKTAPGNGTTDRSLALTLRWTPAIGANAGYGYCIDQTDDNACDGGDQGYVKVTETIAALPNLLPNTTYYWQVRAYNQFGDFVPANNDIWFNFTTVAAEVEPPTYGPRPLPGDSGDVGPPGEPGDPTAICCMAGYVYYDGVPIADPQVTVTDKAGNTVPTNPSIKEGLDYYAITLHGRDDLDVAVGDIITLNVAAGTNHPAHTATYRVKAGPQQFDIVIPGGPTNTAPVATLNRVFQLGVVDTNDRLVFEGMGQDSDSTPEITAYEWRSDQITEVLGTTATLVLPPNRLAIGLHTIRFRVRDDEGVWSPTIELTLDVRDSTDGWTLLYYLAGDQNDTANLGHRFGEVIGEISRNLDKLPTDVNVLLLRDGHGFPTTLHDYPDQGDLPAICESLNAEQAMNRAATLTQFLDCAKLLFPGTHYALIIADHGHAIRGTAWDDERPRLPGATEEEQAKEVIYLPTNQVDDAIRASTLGSVDILYFDSCSMGLLETAYEMHDVANYLIASQYLAWTNFNYHRYFDWLTAEMIPQDVARRMAQNYADSIYANLPFTISVLELWQVDKVAAAVDTLVNALMAQLSARTISPSTLGDIRAASQVLESAYTGNHYELEPRRDFYIDLADWAGRIVAAANTDEASKDAAKALLSFLEENNGFVVMERSASGNMYPEYGGKEIVLDDVHGVSIFYPLEDPWSVRGAYIGGQYFDYTTHAKWDEFLQAVHGSALQPGVEREPLPDPIAPLAAPNVDGQAEKQIFLPVIVR